MLLAPNAQKVLSRSSGSTLVSCTCAFKSVCQLMKEHGIEVPK